MRRMIRTVRTLPANATVGVRLLLHLD